MSQVFWYGSGVGALISVILYFLMSLVVLYPRSAAIDIVFRVAKVLWPTAPLLMAVQNPGATMFGMVVLAVGVLSNGVLYGILALAGWFVLRRLR